MTLPGLSALRLDHLLGITLALLLGLALWPWLAPEAGSAPRPEKPTAPPPALTVLPPQANFTAIVDRPLFSPSRRPAPGAGSGNRGSGIEARYQLLGLVVSENVRRAWLAEGERHFDVGEGDKLDGWTVTRIQQDRIVLTSATGQAVLALRRPAEETGAKASEGPPKGQ